VKQRWLRVPGILADVGNPLDSVGTELLELYVTNDCGTRGRLRKLGRW
jgi:hypothetical protein